MCWVQVVISVKDLESPIPLSGRCLEKIVCIKDNNGEPLYLIAGQTPNAGLTMHELYFYCRVNLALQKFGS